MDVPLTSSLTVRLILERVPFDLTEIGLWNFLESRRICPLLDLRLVKRRRYRDFMERCTNHAYLTVETEEEAEKIIQEIHAKPPLNLTVRIIELGQDDRPAPTYDSGEDSKQNRTEEVSTSRSLKSRSARILRNANVENTNSNVIRDSKLPLKPPPTKSSSRFEEITIHEPKVLPDDQDIFRYNSPIILTDVKTTQLPPCAACYQPSQYLCRQTLKEAYCSRRCQVKCLIEKKKMVETEKREDSNRDDDGDKLCSLDNNHQSAESPSNKDEGVNFDDTRNTINSSIPSVDDMKLGELVINSHTDENVFFVRNSSSDSSYESLPPFTSCRINGHGHLDETTDSGKIADSSTDESSPPPVVTHLDLLPRSRSALFSISSKSDSTDTTASLLPNSSKKDYNPFDQGDSDTTIPLPSSESDTSSYSPFTSTKMEDDERCIESPPPLRSAMAMKNPGQDLNRNPWIAKQQALTGEGAKCRRDDSTSSEESLPPFKYFRDGDNKMVPIGQNQTFSPDNKETYLSALSKLGETISKLKVAGDSNREKPSQVSKETQTDSSEIPKTHEGTQTDLQRCDMGTQTLFQTAQTSTQTENINGIVRIEEGSKSAVAVSVKVENNEDDFAFPEVDLSDPFFSLSPDDPHSYFGPPLNEDFKATILYFKSQSQIFICTKSTFAKLKDFQVNCL